MKIIKISIQNFRLLKEFTIDLEEDLSLIIGKNNSGKTSVLTALDKFLNASDKKKISFDDFNVDFKTDLIAFFTGEQKPKRDSYVPLMVGVKLFIEYGVNDDLSQVSPLIMSLDPEDNNIIISFEYELKYDRLIEMISGYEDHKAKYNNDPVLFVSENQSKYFEIIKKSVLSSDHSVFIDLKKENFNLKNVISFDFISAKRNVTNNETDGTLSLQTSQIYKRTSESKDQEDVIDDFKKRLRETDHDLSGIYEKIFEDLLGRVNKFGGMKKRDTDLKIASTLQHRELLNGNTTVLYSHGNHELPESYNGLGYMNLISMIFEIEMLMGQFKRSTSEIPAVINLFFIEEPEAHTHPQMQYVFIKNIKSLLRECRRREDGILINLQTVVSTHSSHIVSECDFNDVKYLKKRLDGNSVESKNLKSLEAEYADEDPELDAIYKNNFRFLKQYLTLNRAELFFAEKAILIEGDTERVLLPAMMKKVDLELQEDDDTPLISQHISIVEVGAHSQTFEKFIDFIGVKTLVITDIDSYYEEQVVVDGVPQFHKNEKPKLCYRPCVHDDPKAEKTSNNSLLFFHGKECTDLDYFLSLSFSEKILSKNTGQWSSDENGILLLAFQTKEKGYSARSFEDSFFHLNKDLLGDSSDRFPSLTKKWFDKYIDNQIGVFEFSEKAVGSKPSLAIEILLNSEVDGDDEYSNWMVPEYIKEGLVWLRKD